MQMFSFKNNFHCKTWLVCKGLIFKKNIFFAGYTYEQNE